MSPSTAAQATHDYLEPLRALADHRPVVFYDQLGAGPSDAPDELALWTNDRLVDELGRLLDALGLDRVHLLGQSWGRSSPPNTPSRSQAGSRGWSYRTPC